MTDAIVHDHAGRLERLKAEGAEHFDPVQFCYLASLTRRLQDRPRISERTADRLSRTLDEFEARFAEARSNTREVLADAPDEPGDDVDSTVAPVSTSPLAALLLALRETDEAVSPGADGMPSDVTLQVPVAAISGPPPALDPPRRELKALSELRAMQARQALDQLIDEAIARTPADAGPMNPHRLVTRAIKQMRALSPAYAHHFAGYIDTLLWLERMGRKA